MLGQPVLSLLPFLPMQSTLPWSPIYGRYRRVKPWKGGSQVNRGGHLGVAGQWAKQLCANLKLWQAKYCLPTHAAGQGVSGSLGRLLASQWRLAVGHALLPTPKIILR